MVGHQGTKPQGVPAAEPERASTFVLSATAFTLDETIPAEIRWLVHVLYALAGEERRATTREGLKSLGDGPFDVGCSYEVLVGKTGWNRARIRKVLEAARPFVTLTGAPRTGFRYHVDLSMKTYRASTDGVAATSVCKERRAQPIPANRRQQLLLDTSLSSTMELNNRESAPDVQSALSSTIEPKIAPNEVLGEKIESEPLSSIVELKEAAHSLEFGSTMELKDTDFSSSIEPEVSILSSSIEPKERHSNVRARKHQGSKASNSEEPPQALLEDLLLLYRVRDKRARITSLPFLTCANDLADLIASRRRCDRGAAFVVLGQIVADPSWQAGSFKDPIGYIRAHIDDLLRVRIAATRDEGDDVVFYRLSPEQRAAAVTAVSSGVATTTWLRANHVPPGAARHARKLLARLPGIAGRVAAGKLSELEPPG